MHLKINRPSVMFWKAWSDWKEPVLRETCCAGVYIWCWRSDLRRPDPPVSGHTLQQQRRPSLQHISQPNLLLTRSTIDLHNYRILSKLSAAVRAFEFLCERTTGGVSAFNNISSDYQSGFSKKGRPCTSVAVRDVLIKLIGFSDGKAQ